MRVVRQLRHLHVLLFTTFAGTMATMRCRFYENHFPDVEETVVVNVRQIADMGAYVSLSEYNGKGASTVCFKVM